jgi:hypothetical protein
MNSAYLLLKNEVNYPRALIDFRSITASPVSLSDDEPTVLHYERFEKLEKSPNIDTETAHMCLSKSRFSRI